LRTRRFRGRRYLSLNEIFIPTAEEFDLAHSTPKSTPLKIVFLVLLKTFQRLGYFLPLHKGPRPIAEHISLIYGVHYQAMEWEAYGASGSCYRFIALMRHRVALYDCDVTNGSTRPRYTGYSPGQRSNLTLPCT
jgi:hypothetical protein